MAGNTFGTLFKLTTFGESHGLALGAVIDGCPAGIALSEDDLQPDLNRRKPALNQWVSQRKEDDIVRLLSGVFEGKTTGTPIALIIENYDARSQDYQAIKDQYRPGHADWSYDKKYGFRDYRGGGRASARETTMRVAAGAIAKKLLKEQYNTHVTAWVSQIGEIVLPFEGAQWISQNPFCCACKDTREIQNYLKAIRNAGDSVGAQIEVEATGIAAGWGEPVFDKLDADIAKAMISIPAVKAVGIGDGFDVVTQRGSQHRDEMTKTGFLSNRAGGILGGISSGQTIRASLAFKPTSSILIKGKSLDTLGNEVEIITKGRHDPCVALRATPIVEAMLALTLADHMLRQMATKH